MNNPVKHLFIIERFENEWVVVEFDGKSTFNIPRSVLPDDASEGDVLQIDICIDIRETKKRNEEINVLVKDLFIDD